jgi:hypothetical protein
MATTFTHANFNDPAVARPQSGINIRTATVTFAAALVANDVFKLFKLPKGAKLVPGGWSIENGADYDTSTNLTLSLQVTDGTTTKTPLAATTIGQGAAAVAVPASTDVGWIGFVTTSPDFYVRLLVAAGPSTSTSGTIKCTASYTTDLERASS